MVICLDRGPDLHMAQMIPLPLTVSCFSEVQTFLVPAHLGSPGKRAVKRARARVCVCVLGSTPGADAAGCNRTQKPTLPPRTYPRGISSKSLLVYCLLRETVREKFLRQVQLQYTMVG